MLLGYALTLAFLLCFTMLYYVYRVIMTLIKPKTTNERPDNYLDDLVGYYVDNDDRPTPINTPDDPQYYPEEPESQDHLINPELLEKNRLHDEKIKRLKDELANVQTFTPGTVFNDNHSDVDALYMPKPKHEYTD